MLSLSWSGLRCLMNVSTGWLQVLLSPLKQVKRVYALQFRFFWSRIEFKLAKSIFDLLASDHVHGEIFSANGGRTAWLNSYQVSILLMSRWFYLMFSSIFLFCKGLILSYLITVYYLIVLILLLERLPSKFCWECYFRWFYFFSWEVLRDCMM